MLTVSLLYFDGCPNWEIADTRLRELALTIKFALEHQEVETPDDAEQMGFRGSPTILVDGVDPFATGDEPFGLACRIFQTPDGFAGSPTIEQLREVLT